MHFADVRIEPARPADLPALAELLARSGLPLDGLAGCLPAALVARHAGAVVGSVALELYGRSALLRSLAADASWRGRGLGQRLTLAALDLARQQGVSQVYLLTETAAGFFPRFGFRTLPRDAVDPAVQRSVEFVSACPASAVAMVADVSSGQEGDPL